MKGIVAWDLDGTIVDTFRLMEVTYKTLLGSDFNPDLSLSPWKNFTSAGRDPNKSMSNYWNLYKMNIERYVHIYPEIDETIDAISKEKYYQVIISSLPDEIVDILLKGISLFEKFDLLIGGSKREFRKPKTNSIKHCSTTLNLPMNKIIMIGDGNNDRILANNAHVYFIAAKWNTHCTIDGDFNCQSPMDVITILNRIFNSSQSL